MTELKPASRTRPALSPTSVASSVVAESTRPTDLAARSASSRPAGVSRIPAAGSLDQLGAELRLQPGQVVADRRLRVAELLGGGGDRSVPPDRVDDA
jgi:hypothetical protein